MALGVDRQVFRLALVLIAEVDQRRSVLGTHLFQGDARSQGTGMRRVEQLDHWVSPTVDWLLAGSPFMPRPIRSWPVLRCSGYFLLGLMPRHSAVRGSPSRPDIAPELLSCCARFLSCN